MTKTVNGYTIEPYADLRCADLRCADLRNADLCNADLSYADLRNANLAFADLRYAHLGDANLSRANLYNANLRDTNLRYVSLFHANLRGVQLKGAKIGWDSHDLIAEILRQHAGDDVSRRSLAGLVLVSRDWCWDIWEKLEHPERDWALGVLRTYLSPDDDDIEHAPELLLQG